MAAQTIDLKTFLANCQAECDDVLGVGIGTCTSSGQIVLDGALTNSTQDLADAPAEDYLNAFRKRLGYVSPTENANDKNQSDPISVTLTLNSYWKFAADV